MFMVRSRWAPTPPTSSAPVAGAVHNGATCGDNARRGETQRLPVANQMPLGLRHAPMRSGPRCRAGPACASGARCGYGDRHGGRYESANCARTSAGARYDVESATVPRFETTVPPPSPESPSDRSRPAGPPGRRACRCWRSAADLNAARSAAPPPAARPRAPAASR